MMSKSLGAALVLAASLLSAGCDYVDTTEVATPRMPQGAASAGSASSSVSYSGTIQPTLTRTCGPCHNSTAMTAGLDLTSYSGMFMISGVVVPGNAEGSLMIQRIERGEMPPGGRPGPTDNELAMIKQWINDGAPNN
jgi:uncharacterized membrane protein